MISFRNGLEYKYDMTAPEFRTAFEFLKRKDLADLPVGWIELENGVRASVQRYTSFGWDENKFEAHEKYFDIQYVVKGRERSTLAKVISSSSLPRMCISQDAWLMKRCLSAR